MLRPLSHPSEPIVVTVAPTSATVLPGETEQLVATVTGTDIDTVTWTTSASAVATVDAKGLVTVLETATTGQTATITATSTEDGTKSATAIITVG